VQRRQLNRRDSRATAEASLGPSPLARKTLQCKDSNSETMPNLVGGPFGAHLRGHRVCLGRFKQHPLRDQNTLTPPAGASWRGEQTGPAGRQLHQHVRAATLRRSAGAREASDQQVRAGGGTLSLLRQDAGAATSAGTLLVANWRWPGQRLQPLASRLRARLTLAASLRALRRLIALRQEQARQLARWRQLADGQPRSCSGNLAQPFAP